MHRDVQVLRKARCREQPGREVFRISNAAPRRRFPIKNPPARIEGLELPTDTKRCRMRYAVLVGQSESDVQPRGSRWLSVVAQTQIGWLNQSIL